ncbi:unnamed protein product [Prorocentrum cordatum]|uniref:Uncharacterized protein n=1 Tax=Prorocentrum cordatum TaxID=2364126 RepID=A0ABN9VFB6_9DINO|nr:unnamed protein product [Polarella glacialis]
MAGGPASLLGGLVALLALRPLSAIHVGRVSGRASTAKRAAWQRLGTVSTTHVDLGSYAGPTNVTGIVTHAGKHALDYIDSAAMLGLVLQRHLPEVPRFAIVIEGMKDCFQAQLRNAGWHLVMVEDWGEEHIGGSADAKFFGRWGDSFEKLNVWRFPLDRVLFLDSDTYVFSDKVREILDTKLEPGQIGMTKDGCKPEHNSGMMLFKPQLSVYDDLLRMIADQGSAGNGREILDQTLVNKKYEGNIVTMDSRFNCVDYQVDPRCKLSCGQDTIVAHFTGNPKPTREGVPHVNLVRHGNISVCQGTNLGGCQLWSRYYCDMKKNANYLSKLLKRTLSQTGQCLSPVALAEEDEAEEKARQEEAERKAKTAAEATAKEATAKQEAEAKAKEEAEAKARQEEAERKAKAAAEAKATEEAKRKTKDEAEARARQEEAERKAKAAAEVKATEEAEAKAKDEAEAKARQEEGEREAKEKAERKAREESVAKAKEETDRKAKEEAEAKARQEEVEAKAKVAAEAKAKEEVEVKARQEEAEPNAKAAAEAKATQEAEAKAKEEAEAKTQQEEAERKTKEEAESKAKEEAEVKARQEEAERKAKEEAEAKARQEEAEVKAKREAERKARKDAEVKAMERKAQRRAKRAAEAKARQEEAEGKAQEADAKARQEEAERTAKEGAETKAKEEAEAKARQEGAERNAKEAAKAQAKEGAEPNATDAAQATVLLSSRTVLNDTGLHYEGTLMDIRKKLEDAMSALPQISETAPVRRALQMRLDEITKKQLEDSIAALPDMPEVEKARISLQEQLFDVNARIR